MITVYAVDDRVSLYDPNECSIQGTIVSISDNGIWLDIRWDDGIQARYHIDDTENIDRIMK